MTASKEGTDNHIDTILLGGADIETLRVIGEIAA